ncbi:MAG: hypothetical protein ACNA71_00425 [Kiritimatiellia bacterium]
MDNRQREKASSAITLSDMEIFIFPELMFSLVLANIMSPRIWKWRADPWFDGIEKMKPYKRITRLKQFIMDHYDFNLDLDTWGLTNAETELARFSDFIDRDTLSQSNALFGYEGDKYYFDIDIRTHFGLDKYEGHIIPYWKTETVEAMDAFCHRPGYHAGAGECVSLAALYAAALFLIAEIPLADIFLLATPLHSQNFVLVNDGILTNNRRLVTKNMWFNGTALSAQARRALENERVTIVSHVSGTIHAIYEEASIDLTAYEHFAKEIRAFLHTPLNKEILGNFIRQAPQDQKCFQLRSAHCGSPCYIPLEKAFAYENGSSYKVTDNTRPKLLREIEREEFECTPIAKRIVLNDLETFIAEKNIDLDNAGDISLLEKQFDCDCLDARLALKALIRFCNVQPRLPEAATKTIRRPQAEIQITPQMSREAIVAHLQAVRTQNTTVDLAFYAYRDLATIEPAPFLKACFERNPVCLAATTAQPTEALFGLVDALASESIYDGSTRLSQPDEAWNFQRGDGLEKALLLANLLHNRTQCPLTIEIETDTVTLQAANETYRFTTTKELPGHTWHYPFT